MVRNFGGKHKKLIIAALLMAVILVLFVWDFNSYTEKEIEDNLRSNMENISLQSKYSLESNIEFLKSRLESQALLFNTKGEMTESEIIDELKSFTNSPLITRTTIIDMNGKVYSSEFGVHKVNARDFKIALSATKTYVGKPRVYEKTGQTFIDIATPVHINGEKFGSLVISYDSDKLRDIFDVAFLDGDYSIILISGEGTIIGRIGDKINHIKIGNRVCDFLGGTETKFINGSAKKMEENMRNGKKGWATYEYKGKAFRAFYYGTNINNWSIMSMTTDKSIEKLSMGIKDMARILVFKVIFIMLILSFVFIYYFFKERRRLEQLKESYRLALKKSNDLFYEVNLDDDTYVSHSEETNILALKKEKCFSMLSKRYSEFCDPEDKLKYLESFSVENIKMKLNENMGIIEFEYKLNLQEGQPTWIRCKMIPISEELKSTNKIICIEKNITVEKTKTEKLKEDANLDGMTGLLNKKAVAEAVDAYLEGEGEKGNHGIYMMDIDFFKEINDRYGHAKGDEVLVDLALLLKKLFRKSDFIGRVGGDEFIAVLKDFGDEGLVDEKAAELCNSFRNMYKLHGIDSEVKTAISVGIAIYPKDGNSFETLYQNADAALYLSKNTGRNKFSYYQNS